MAVSTSIAPASETLVRQLFHVCTEEDVLALASAVPGARWRPLGGRGNNYSTIHVGADPGDALVERVTNGIDALVERELLRSGAAGIQSPRGASEKLFGIPGGRLSGLSDEATRRRLAERLRVTLRDSGDAKRPTVVVEDNGIGQNPLDFPTTLLSFNENNKVQRPELMGAYGQGGSSVFAFTDLAVFISRRDPAFLDVGRSDLVGWTVVRFNPLDDDHKTGMYEYLVAPNERGEIIVPAFDPSLFPPEYKDFVGCHFVAARYELERFSDSIFQPKKSLWHLFNVALFDPTYPILARDERAKALNAKDGKERERALKGLVINGNATRLADDKRHNVEYDNTHAVQLSEGNGTALIRYWALNDSGDPKKDWERMANYVPHEQAVTITLNGQRQGTMRRDIFNRLGLMSLGKALIVQTDCDQVSKHAKRQLFSATRDRMKDSTVARELENGIRQALMSDAELRALDKGRKNRALARQSASEAERINRLLKDAIGSLKQGLQQAFRKLTSTNTEYQLLGDQPLLDESTGENDPSPPPGPETELTEPPLHPTDLRILNPTIRVPSGGAGVVRLMLDAPDDYISPDPSVSVGTLTAHFSKGGSSFRLTGHSALRRGVVRATIAAAKGIPAGEQGRIIFAVTRPDDLPLLGEADVVTVEPPKPRAKPVGQKQGQEQAPNVIPVDREGWVALGLSEEAIARVEEDNGEAKIYVFKQYPPLMTRLNREQVPDEYVVDYQSKFVAAMALAAWLQYDAQRDSQDRSDQDVLDAELRRTAEVYMFAQSVAREKSIFE